MFFNRKVAEGFTLVESLVALGLTALLLSAVVSITLFTTRSLAGLANHTDLDQADRLALDRMTREIRRCTAVAAFQINRLDLLDFEGQRLVYQYDPSTRKLVQTRAGVAQTLLRDCDRFEFTVFNSEITDGNMNLVVAANPTARNVIGLRWDCSKAMTGPSRSQGAGHSVTVVIRNN